MLQLLLLAAAAPPLAAADGFTDDAQWAAVAASVRVTGRGDSNPATGVVVGSRGDDDFVLTAAHAVPVGDDYRVQPFARATYPTGAAQRPATVVVRHAEADFALLKVPRGELKHLPSLPLGGPGRRPKRFPFDALSVGCSHSASPTCEAVTVRAKRLVRRPADAVAFFWEATREPAPGRSGGPLLDRAGRVVGVCAAAQDGQGYYVHLDEILAGLKRNGYEWLWAEK